MDEHANAWLHVGIGLGFVSGFWIICGTLLLKESQRDAYFNFLVKIKDNIYVSLAVKCYKISLKVP